MQPRVWATTLLSPAKMIRQIQVMSEIDMLGDSLTRRLESHSKRNGINIGINFRIALSGAKISHIKQIIKSSSHELNSCQTLIIWIGTNDIFSNSDFKQIKDQYKSLLRVISNNISPKQIIIIDLPIFPKANNNEINLNKLNKFNAFLHTLSSPNIKVMSVQHILNSVSCFNLKYSNSNRQDGIHLNNKGNNILLQFLIKSISQTKVNK